MKPNSFRSISACVRPPAAHDVRWAWRFVVRRRSLPTRSVLEPVSRLPLAKHWGDSGETPEGKDGEIRVRTGKFRFQPWLGLDAATGAFTNGCVETEGLVLAPQVGLEPTTLRLTAEFQGEAVRSGKRKLLKIGVSQSWSRPQFRMACKKSSYKSSYSACGYRNCLSHGWAFRGNEPSGRVSSSIPVSPPVMTRAS